MEKTEAIKIIKSATVYTPEEMEALETLIPELKESRDEQIRKAIIKSLDVPFPEDNLPGTDVTYEEAIAYLEKKKEPIPVPDKFSGLKSLMLQYLQSAANRKDDAEIESDTDLWGRKILDYVWKYDEKQKEQKPVEKEITLTSFEETLDTFLFDFANSTIEDCEPKEYIKKHSAEILKAAYKELNAKLQQDIFEARQEGIRDGYEVAKAEQKPAEIAPNQFDGITYGMQGYSTEKPAEWNEDWREEDIQTRFAFYTYKDEDGVLYLSNVFVEEASRNHGFGTKILAAAEKVAKTIGATTISLKVKQDSPANAWYRKNGYGYVAFEDGYDWLEKNLEYMKPNKQGWSEEDEKKIHFLSRLIEFQVKDDEYCFGDGSLISKQEAIEMLKSLRPQPKAELTLLDKNIISAAVAFVDLNPYNYWCGIDKRTVIKALRSLRPSWKPSVEQMNTLLSVEGILRSLRYDDKAKILASIYEQLKQFYP